MSCIFPNLTALRDPYPGHTGDPGVTLACLESMPPEYPNKSRIHLWSNLKFQYSENDKKGKSIILIHYLYTIVMPYSPAAKCQKRARGRSRVCPNFYCSLLFTGMCTLILWIFRLTVEKHRPTMFHTATVKPTRSGPTILYKTPLRNCNKSLDILASTF